MEEQENNQAILVKIDKSLNDLIQDFIKRFEAKYNVKPSPREATKIIADKIISVGGLKVN